MLLCGCAVATLAAQTDSAPGELPAALQQQLTELRDYELNFGQPPFYALLAHLQHSPAAPGRYQQPLTADDIPDLLARPGDFRGYPVRIHGTVGRSSSWKRNQGTAAGRPVWQLELQVPDSPVAATLILTESAADLPLGAEIEATAYFALVRSYYDTRQRLRHALLLVGHAPDQVTVRAPRPPEPAPAWPAAVALSTGVAALLWILVRRWSRRGVTARPQRNPKPAAFSVADDFQSWAAEDDPAGQDETVRDDH